MITQTKWDIVDDVVAYEPMSTDMEKVSRIRAKLSKVATSAVFGAVVLASGFVMNSKLTTLHVTSFGTSAPVQLSERLKFVRPRGNRAANAAMAVDTLAGMSTRRLGELHQKLFIPDTSVQEELTGDYAFL
jgi:hypothetical protein